MLDKDKILKVRGILSAKSGTQVPKFYDGYKIEYSGKNNETQFAYSKDGLNWYLDEGLITLVDNTFLNSEVLNEFYNNHPELEGSTKLNTEITIPDPTKIQTDPKITNEAGTESTSGNAAPSQTSTQQSNSVAAAPEAIDSPEELKAKVDLNAANNQSQQDLNKEGVKPEEQDKPLTVLLPEINSITVRGSKEALTHGSDGTTNPDEIVVNGISIPKPTFSSQNLKGKDKRQFEKSQNIRQAKEAYNNYFSEDNAEQRALDNEKLQKMGGGIKDLALAGADALSSREDWADDDPSLGAGRSVYNSAAGALFASGNPVLAGIGGGMMAAGILNDSLGGSTMNFSIDQSTQDAVGGDYTGSYADMLDASDHAGKKYGLVGLGKRNKWDKNIVGAINKLLAITDIADDTFNRKDNTYLTDTYALEYSRRMNGGWKNIHVGKLGGELNLEDNFDILISSPENSDFLKSGGTLDLEEDTWEPIITEDINILKEGGAIKDSEIEVIETNTNLKSVIPEGALHKNKHHLDEVGIDDSELTKKGIPVVDNKGEQLAEIELNEIIFTLEVTKELEKRYKEFYDEETSKERKNELALEAGKLLWKEIIYNTDDRTGLIDTLKQGGTLKVQNNSPEIREESRITKHAEGGYVEFIPVSTTVAPVKEETHPWEEFLPTLEELAARDLIVVQETLESPETTVEAIPLIPTGMSIWGQGEALVSPTTVTPIPSNINLQGWDISKTLQHLRQHAHDKSTHWCARYVRQALEAGGLTGFRVEDARDEVKQNTLKSIGFVKVADAVDNKVTSGYTPQAGDVAISYENGNHAAMFDGTTWISDFRQKGLDVYDKKNTKSAIYRRIGLIQPEVSLAKNGGIFYSARNLAKKHII